MLSRSIPDRSCWLVVLISLVLLETARGHNAFGEEQRRTIPLDGTWELAQGPLATPPEQFPHQVPVPGLVDLARPPLEEIGTERSREYREVFWYRRTFRLDGPVPPLARLKINKARYGTQVYLNGNLVGEHLPCFTPAVFDVTQFLKGSGEENVLLIRVGAHRTSLPPGIPDGWDFEKIRYIPGIYDSVQLILSGRPEIVRVQAVPDIEHRRVTFYVTLGPQPGETETDVQCVVREVPTGASVAQGRVPSVRLPTNQEAEVVIGVDIPNCRLWSPEDPFLYEAELSTKGDSCRVRFGMRSFKFDPVTKMALLNGQPYPLRGTNVCIYRFFEDPMRGDLPWRDGWVRKLHETFRFMHWNSMRYCIGFPPERWYDIADEVGLLIQDEFPIWYLSQWPKELTWEELAREYAAWIHERCNHPSVVIWDAQNETVTEETGRAIQAVRHLDRSGRPWDNGWSAPQDPGDVFESHPYPFFSPKGQNKPSQFRLSDLAGKPRQPQAGLLGNVRPNSGNNPVIINEYGWLWLNRDGSPTTLSQANYQALLGPDASPDRRRQLYARYIAVMTEFWRSGRQVAGVMHFCGLGYSRPGGETSDNFVDLQNLLLEPHFARVVRDAFSPIIAIVDFYQGQVEPGTKLEVPLVVLNDLATEWQGTVQLRLVAGDSLEFPELEPGSLVAEQHCTLAPVDRRVLTFSVEFPVRPGVYQLIGQLRGPEGQPVRSLRRFEVRQKPE